MRRAKGKANQSAGDGQWSRQTSRSKCGTTGSAKRLELSSDSIERGWRFFFLHWRKSHALWWATNQAKRRPAEADATGTADYRSEFMLRSADPPPPPADLDA
jgi:hypothetical protein